MLFIHALNAQLREFTIAEMPRPEVAVVQANVQFPEDALVLVYAAIEGLEFRSSLGAIDKQTYNASASRYELLLKPVKQMLFAAKAGFIEAKITTLNPNPKDVYYFRVEEKKEAQPVQSEPGTLQISSEPAGADIYLNGVKIADKTPFSGEVNAGFTRVKIKKKKYEEFDTTVQVLSNAVVQFARTLQPTSLWLNVKSQPDGAAVSLAGKVIGTTPFSYEVDLTKSADRGNKTLQLIAPGYDTLNQIIIIQPSSIPREFSFTLSKKQGQISITSIPAGADVFVDDVFKGHTPLDAFSELGRFDVHVKLEDYKTSGKKSIEVNSDQIAELQFVLIPNDSSEEPTDEQVLKELQIGTQTWSQNNLAAEHFQNGDLIQEIRDEKEWVRASESGTPAWCYPENNQSNGLRFGKLYNWYAVNDPRNICPAGWHVPSDAEWNELSNFLGGAEKVGEKLSYFGKNGQGSDIRFLGFNEFPAGIRLSNGKFYYFSNDVYWWSSTSNSSKDAINRYIIKDSKALNRTSYYLKSNALSVKCVKD